MTCWLAGCSSSGNHPFADGALPAEYADGPLGADLADGASVAERADGTSAVDRAGDTISRLDARVPVATDDGSYGDPVLRFDGLYQLPNDDGYTYYLRFFADLTVLEVSSSGTAEQVATWLKRGTGKGQQGQFLLDGTSISFVVSGSTGSVEYNGQVGVDQLVLQVHSLINDYRATNTYTFVPL